MNIIEKFDQLKSRVQHKSGCWIYPSQARYARVEVAGRTISAHRIAWIASFGAIPTGLCVCHKCDVPRCINPEHLWLATVQENMADRQRKNRQTKGVKITNSKLTPTFVRKLRSLHPSGLYTNAQLGKRFGVDGSTVSKVVNRKSWRHVK